MKPWWLCFTVCLACGDAGSRSPQVIAADTAPLWDQPFSQDELRAYERGRRQEIAALRSEIGFAGGVIDSIGAGAAGLATDDYRRLTGTIDSYLKQRLQQAATELTVAVPVSDSLLALLDSLRVERWVLRVRIGS